MIDNTLFNAVNQAIVAWNSNRDEDDICGSIAVAKRVHHDNKIEWFVALGWSNNSFLTILDENRDLSAINADDLTNEILSCWNEDWNDIQVENPVGDFSLGSADFRSAA